MLLVLAGMGFLGVNLGRYLAETGQQCVLTKLRTSRIPEFLAPYVGKQVHIVPCDMRDRGQLEAVIRDYGVNGIIHLAHTWRYEGAQGLDQVIRNNVLGSLNVFAVALTHGLRVTFISSSTVYFGLPGPWSEDAPLPVGTTIVNACKIAEENLGSLYRELQSLDLRVVRPPRIYGPLYVSGLSPVARMMDAAAAGKSVDLPEINRHDGGDFTFVRDCARATVMVHLAGQLPHHVYNVGAGRFITHGEIAGILMRATGIKIALGDGPDADQHSHAVVERIRADLGFIPEYDIERGTLAWLDFVRSGGQTYLAN